jgi:hypothetical protein
LAGKLKKKDLGFPKPLFYKELQTPVDPEEPYELAALVIVVE